MTPAGDTEAGRLVLYQPPRLRHAGACNRLGHPSGRRLAGPIPLPLEGTVELNPQYAAARWAPQVAAKESTESIATDRRVAGFIALFTAVFGMLVQFEIYAAYASGPAINASAGNADGSLRAFGTYLLAFPLLQLESLLVAVVVGLAYLYSRRRRALRWAAIGLALVVNIWCILDQMTFNLLRQHVSLFDEDVTVTGLTLDAPRLVGSMLSEADWIAVLNVVLVAAAIRLAWRVAHEPHAVRLMRWRFTPRFGVAAGAYVMVSAVMPGVVGTRGIHHHPMFAVFMTSRPAAAIALADAEVPDSVSRRGRFGAYPPDGGVRQRLAAFQANAAGLHKPNVLFVILESVGSEQMLPNGMPDPAVTPNLARLAQRAAIFPNLYTVYPSTTRAHVPMMTGGSTITWGSVHLELSLPYLGSTLPSALRSAGYRAGLFAAVDMRFAALERFYRSMPWDTVLHYGDGSGPLDPRQKVHSWGVNEDYLWTHARRWIEGGERSNAPFFLNFQTVSTHHPYGTAPGFSSTRVSDQRRPRYYNSVAYTDMVLGRILADLEASGKAKNTIVVITGDHGQAFGDRHENNIGHRNFLYEENVRTFAMFAVPGAGQAVVSERIGTTGDLMPSLLALLGLNTAPVQGQNLFSPWFERRLAYFHKDTPPHQWGLRDGQWKFIDELTGETTELYDLSRDPLEQNNLADEYPDLVAQYRRLVRDWYLRANVDYIAHLKGYEPPLLSAIPRTKASRTN